MTLVAGNRGKVREEICESTSGVELPASCPPQRKVMSAGSQRRPHRSLSQQRPHQLGGEYGCLGLLTAGCFTPRGEIRLSSDVHPHHDAAERNVMVASSVEQESGGPIHTSDGVNRPQACIFFPW